MTPLQIEIMLHYHCITTDYEQGYYPAQGEAIRAFRASGMLEVNPDPDGTKLRITDKGRAYCEALQAVPIPEDDTPAKTGEKVSWEWQFQEKLEKMGFKPKDFTAPMAFMSEPHNTGEERISLWKTKKKNGQ